MSRWLAGAFDGGGRIETSALVSALLPDAATLVDRPPLRLAYSGSERASDDLLCLLDGHLDNSAELLHELGGPGASASAPEDLLAEGYRRWGRELPRRLRGDFVLLVWDFAREQGLIARDQLGVRPLFVHETGGVVRFAGEVRHLLAMLPRRPAPDTASVAHWITLGARPGPQTLYTGIRRLEPGTMLVFDRSGARTERYWEPRFQEPLEIPEDELVERMREALRLAVRRRIAARGGTAVLMSGGLDSSSVAALCAAEASEPMYACSAVFPDHPQVDESELIATLRSRLELPGVEAQVRPGGMLASALESLAAWEMPLLGWGDFWTLPLMREAAARGVTTMLDGDGGDQLFGARIYLLADRVRAGRPWQAFTLAHEFPGLAARPPRRVLARLLWDFALCGALPYNLHNVLGAHSARSAAPAWLRPHAARALMDTADPHAWKRLHGPRWWAHEAHLVTRGIEEAGIFEHQRRRAALGGVEARHPLLDLDLFELCLRQPPRLTLNRPLSRPLLRAAMAGRLPDSVRLRPEKARFDSLLVDCLRGPDGQAVRGLLSAPDMELAAYVERDAVRDALFGSQALARGNEFRWMWQVWRLLTMECWLRSQARPPREPLAPGTHASDMRVVLRSSP